MGLTLGLRFISCATSPHSLPLSPWYYFTVYIHMEVTWRAGGKRAGEERGIEMDLPLCTFSPNYVGSISQFNKSEPAGE